MTRVVVEHQIGSLIRAETALPWRPRDTTSPSWRIRMRRGTLQRTPPAGRGRRMRVTTNSASAVTTIDGPDGVSYSAEANNPPAIETMPAVAAPAAILSGLAENHRTMAAGITSTATISSTPQPRSRRIPSISSWSTFAPARQRVRELGVVCLIDEPHFDRRLINTVIEGRDVRSGTVDSGPALYCTLLRDMAATFRDCPTPSG